jgi:hypothetical protein
MLGHKHWLVQLEVIVLARLLRILLLVFRDVILLSLLEVAHLDGFPVFICTRGALAPTSLSISGAPLTAVIISVRLNSVDGMVDILVAREETRFNLPNLLEKRLVAHDRIFNLHNWQVNVGLTHVWSKMLIGDSIIDDLHH